MSEDDHVDMEDSPFPMFWKKDGEEDKEFQEAQEAKAKIFDTEEYQKLLFSGQRGGSYFDKKHEFYDTILGNDLMKIFPIITLIDTNDVLIYDEGSGMYKPEGKNRLKNYIVQILDVDYKKRYAEAVIDYIMAKTFTERKDLGAPIQFIPVKNGVLDISELPPKLLPHDSKYRFTYQLPVVYDPDAVCPKFLEALCGILPDENLRTQIQEMFGWTLWRDYHIQDAIMFFGDGNNGKDTLLSVLKTLLGEDNIASIPLQSLCEDKFLVAELHQRFANIMADIPKGKFKGSNIFKSLTGGTLITAQKKFGQPFKFVNYAKLIFSANEMPYSYDQTFAYYRRWVLIFFSIRFGTKNHPMDKHIFEKITTPEELSGILNWALEGLKRLDEQDGFTGRMSVEETREYYDQLVSPAYTFVTDNIMETKDPADFIAKEYLWNEINEYCEQNKLLKPTSRKQIAGIIKRSFKHVKPAQRSVDKPHTYVWLNCKFIDEERQKKYEEWVIEVASQLTKIIPPKWEPEE